MGKPFVTYTLLEYDKAGAVAKNLLIIDLCTGDPVRAKPISKKKYTYIYQNDNNISYCDYFATYTQIMSELFDVHIVHKLKDLLPIVDVPSKILTI